MLKRLFVSLVFMAAAVCGLRAQSLGQVMRTYQERYEFWANFYTVSSNFDQTPPSQIVWGHGLGEFPTDIDAARLAEADVKDVTSIIYGNSMMVLEYTMNQGFTSLISLNDAVSSDGSMGSYTTEDRGIYEQQIDGGDDNYADAWGLDDTLKKISAGLRELVGATNTWYVPSGYAENVNYTNFTYNVDKKEIPDLNRVGLVDYKLQGSGVEFKLQSSGLIMPFSPLDYATPNGAHQFPVFPYGMRIKYVNIASLSPIFYMELMALGPLNVR